MNDAQLLQEFTERGSESAFRSLVERHFPLVGGTARRVTGNAALAEEVAQTVFTLLARKAPALRSTTVLSGWLYRTTCFVAARALRAEQRRQRREQQSITMQNQNDPSASWTHAVPQLDAALGELGATDREALLLRYFEELPMRDLGVNLGITEEAAKKRVSRALEKLRRLLCRRGTGISTTALIAGLAQEAARGAAVAGNPAVVSAAALGAASSGGSALVADVLAAWKLAKLKLAVGIGAGVVATALVLTTVLSNPEGASLPQPVSARPVSAAGSATLAASTDAGSEPFPSPVEFAGHTIPIEPLHITVLDAFTGEPVTGAELTHSMMAMSEGLPRPVPFRTGDEGVAVLPVPRLPDAFPGHDRMTQFQVWVRANEYAPREIMWLSSTGCVLNLVSNDYTVRIEGGLTLFGTVMNESGQPLPDVRLQVSGSDYRGYSSGSGIPPAVRVEDFASFSAGFDADTPVVSDRVGRFQITHFPSELKSLMIELIGSDGARRKYRTPRGDRLSSDEMEEIDYEALQTGTARLILPRGITVEGIVLDMYGNPVPGATVTEAVQWGNLKVLSRTDADPSGRFWLSNRPPRELIIAASGRGHASASTIATVQPGMDVVRIQLPPALPLRGRVVNEAGEPVAQASVQLVDIYNDGLGFEWSGTTDGEGRFVWYSAPTNEVKLAIASAIFAPRLVSLSASTNEHRITLTAQPFGIALVTGSVTDAASGKPVDRFTVKICHSRHGIFPSDVAQTVTGSNGKFELSTARSEVPPGNHAVWLLMVEADGYEAAVTRDYAYGEGDQDLQLQLHPGDLAGLVRRPDAEPAVDCQVAALSELDYVFSYQPGTFFPRSNGKVGRTDRAGQFKISRPFRARSLVVFGEHGWAIQRIGTGTDATEIQLLPWGQIEGELKPGGTPIAGEKVVLSELVWDPASPIQLVRTTTTDAAGRFAFEKVPAGEYQVALVSDAWQKSGRESVRALQMPVIVSAGETQRVHLTEAGQSVSVKLQPPKSATAINWHDATAILRRDVFLPPRPSRSQFVSDASHSAAVLQYTRDPAVISAMRQARSYVGRIAADGVVNFENVPPGHYVFEAKLFAANNEQDFGSVKIVGRANAPVSVSPEGDSTNGMVALGTFRLEAL